MGRLGQESRICWQPLICAAHAASTKTSAIRTRQNTSVESCLDEDPAALQVATPGWQTATMPASWCAQTMAQLPLVVPQAPAGAALHRAQSCLQAAKHPAMRKVLASSRQARRRQPPSQALPARLSPTLTC